MSTVRITYLYCDGALCCGENDAYTVGHHPNTTAAEMLGKVKAYGFTTPAATVWTGCGTDGRWQAGAAGGWEGSGDSVARPPER